MSRSNACTDVSMFVGYNPYRKLLKDTEVTLREVGKSICPRQNHAEHNKAQTVWLNLEMYEALSYFSDLTLSQAFQPITALSKKAPLPLADILATASYRSSKPGPSTPWLHIENRESSWCQLCCHWRHRKLSLRQPLCTQWRRIWHQGHSRLLIYTLQKKD